MSYRGPTSAPRQNLCPQCGVTLVDPPAPPRNGLPAVQQVCPRCRQANIDEQTRGAAEALLSLRDGPTRDAAEALMTLRYGHGSAQCDVCVERRVAPGQRRCAECIVDPNTPTTPTMAFFASQGLCVICERNYAVEGTQHCRTCSFAGQRSGQPLRPMDDIAGRNEATRCAHCGLACPVTEGSNLCLNCRNEGIPEVRPESGELVWSSSNESSNEPPDESLGERMCGCGKHPVRDSAATMCMFCYRVFQRVGRGGWRGAKRDLGWK
ncbi:hypothetical protein CPLU01_04413 [Colletotrichum plurivorum]|uniref:Uncharacterized protein n=1 Tax=Colletotrichum plurivorum TaxID=2175906 RepID=A0A8H6KQ54_9PEZI|nr:hypothetical protein CPLU01_04413 [Colletotrichum plurivorum]